MFISKFLTILITVVLSYILYQYLEIKIFIPYDKCEVNTCPYCYGKTLCDQMKKEYILKTSSFSEIFNNFVSVKNVYRTETNVVFKKLAYFEEFEELNKTICESNKLGPNCNFNDIYDRNDYETKVINLLIKPSDFSINKLKVCSGVGYLQNLIKSWKPKNATWNDYFINIWTLLKINPEPIMLQMLKAENNWPVPEYLGACGRMIAVQDSGELLNDFENFDWLHRAYLALQILEAAYNFTENHEKYRIYLTDISPDNIAVDEKLIARFIDLENVIMVEKIETEVLQLHETKHYGEYTYSEREICKSLISDHNYYAVCMLLLWKNAPWPMMPGGLLHSIPEHIKYKSEINKLIDQCINPNEGLTRIDLVDDLIRIFKTILKQHNYIIKH